MSPAVHTGLLLAGLLVMGAVVYVPAAVWLVRTSRVLLGAAQRSRRPAPPRRPRPAFVLEVPPPDVQDGRRQRIAA